MDFTKTFNVVMSNLYLANFISQADLHILYCECRTELFITRIIFHQIVLCLNASKINHPGSDFRRLNQYWLLSCTELNCFLASCRWSLCSLNCRVDSPYRLSLRQG